MHKIVFVTGNTGKYEEVKRWLSQLDATIDLEQAPINLIEIQSLDVEEIALSKAHQAWELIKSPLLIDDGGIYFEHYNKFPGTLSKYVYEGIGLDGLWLLAQNDPRAYFLSCLVYQDSPTTPKIFQGTCSGIITKPEPSLLAHASLPYTKMFIPHGSTQTLAELRGSEEEKNCHHRYKALSQFVNWLKRT